MKGITIRWNNSVTLKLWNKNNIQSKTMFSSNKYLSGTTKTV